MFPKQGIKTIIISHWAAIILWSNRTKHERWWMVLQNHGCLLISAFLWISWILQSSSFNGHVCLADSNFHKAVVEYWIFARLIKFGLSKKNASLGLFTVWHLALTIPGVHTQSSYQFLPNSNFYFDPDGLVANTESIIL